MTENERLQAALESARARFHGLACAVALHLRVDGSLDLEKLLELLRDGNHMAACALGYRGPQGIAEVEKVLQEKGVFQFMRDVMKKEDVAS